MKSIRNFKNVLLFLKRDIARYKGVKFNPLSIIIGMFFQPGIAFCIFYRFERYLLYESNPIFKILGKMLYPVYFLFTYYLLSYHIEPEVEIADGLLLHNREIVMTERLKIGRNFSCMGQTTIGVNQLKEHGDITIGDNVFLGVGAKIIASGDLHISEGIEIGANAVVIKSLSKKNGIYAGVPVHFLGIVDRINYLKNNKSQK